MLRLLPLSRREAANRPQAPLPWEPEGGEAEVAPASIRDLWASFLRGQYPELVAQPGRDTALWHSAYVQTYLERDVRSLRQVGDLSQYQVFLRALAARSAQLVKLSELGRDLGVALNTVKAWLSVLEATFQVTVLRPYHANVGKRLVKTPKIYFTDVGTLCYLTGLKDPDHAASGPLAGAIFETAVLAEIVKALIHRGVDPQVYLFLADFRRDRSGLPGGARGSAGARGGQGHGHAATRHGLLHSGSSKGSGGSRSSGPRGAPRGDAPAPGAAGVGPSVHPPVTRPRRLGLDPKSSRARRASLRMDERDKAAKAKAGGAHGLHIPVFGVPARVRG